MSLVRFKNKNTRRAVKNALKQFFLPALDLPLSTFDKMTCQRRYFERVEAVSAATQQYELTQVKTFFDWAMASGFIKTNPASEITRLGCPRRGKKQFRRSEFERFTKTCLERETEPFIALYILAMTGLRPAELLNRRVSDFDECSQGSFLFIPKSKTAAGVREIELPEVLAMKVRRLTLGKPPDAHLFRCRSKSWLRRAMIKACAAAKVPYICPYALRGSHASMAKKAGASAVVLIESLGHADYRTTRENYLNPGTESSARIYDLTARLGSQKTR